MQLSRLLPPLSLVLLTLLGTQRASADEASGTWTGQVATQANYYWETSTRVVAPEVSLRLESPEGVRVDGAYLLDSITSASIAAGVQEDIRFTEIRHQGNLALSREFSLGDNFLRLGVNGRLSHEPDYIATGVGLSGAFSFNQRSTVLAASLSYIHDEVGAVVRGVEVRVDPNGRNLSDRGRQGQLEGITAGLSLSQVLSPVSTLVVGYQMVHNYGYLQNPYRRAQVAGGLTPERHPGTRSRHTLHGRYAHFFPLTRTAVHLLYRAYIDDWQIGALTPEVRIYQMLGDAAMLRLRWRYYDQVESEFQSDQYTGDELFVTADQKMARFDSHLLGVQVRVGLSFLRRTPLAFLDRAWMNLSFNYWFQTSGFGDGVIAQGGVRVPF